jgi:hypothetical protein
MHAFILEHGGEVSDKPSAESLGTVTQGPLMLPGYLRKNGVPYSASAVLNEYFNFVTGGQGEPYFVVTAMVDDPTYLNLPFIRTYNFKKQPDASGWEPTPCLPR